MSTTALRGGDNAAATRPPAVRHTRGARFLLLLAVFLCLDVRFCARNNEASV